MTIRQLSQSIFFLALFLAATSAYAFETIRVPGAGVRVFSQPSLQSPMLALIPQGKVIQIWGSGSDGFKKVYVRDSSGKNKIGFIAVNQLGGDPRGGTRNSIVGYDGGLHRRWSLGVSVGGVYNSQSSQTLTDSNNNSIVGAGLSSFSPELGAFVLYPWSKKSTIDGHILFKSYSLKGTYTLNSTGGTLTLSQTFVSFGAIGRYYLGNNFWAGAGIQLDFGLSDSAQLNSQTFTTSTNQFVFLHGAMGYDLQLSPRLFLTPDFRLGALINASPIMIEADIVVNLAYRL